MNSDQIFDLIEKAAANSSRLFKEQVVAEIVADPLGKRVLVAALDPFTTYGIAKVLRLPTAPAGGRTFNALTWALLESLASRQLTGNDARWELGAEMDALSPKSAELLKRIITKDLRAGFTDGTVNKAAKGTIKEFPYMRCCLPKDAKLEKFDWERGVYSQEKADGMFANVDVEAGGVLRVTSRQGTPFPLEGGLRELADELVETFKDGTQTHGELVVYNDGYPLPREQSNGILNSVAQGGALPDRHHYVGFFCWDQIPLEAVKPKGSWTEPYAARWIRLMAQVKKANVNNVALIPTRVVVSIEEAYEHYRLLLSQGKEGTIVKDRHGLWKDGTSKHQVKLKLEVDVDLKIVGFNVGNGKNAATFGSIVCRTCDDLLEVSVSGMSDKVRKEIHDNAANVVGSIMTVKANAIMAPSAETNNLFSLFLPRYVEIRTDKREADSLQRVQDQFEFAARGGGLKEAA